MTCQPPPLAPPAPRLALPESLAVTAPVLALLPPPAVPPPPPPPAQGLQTQAQTQPQAQAQSQLQTGTQDQQQAQAELALALQDDRDEQVLAMSAREVPATVRLASLALMTSVAGAYALRRRVAVRPVRTPR